MTDGYRPPKPKTKTRYVVCGSDDWRYRATSKKDARRMADHWDAECADLEPDARRGPHKVFKVTTTREVVELERPSEPRAHTVTYDPAKGAVVVDGPLGMNTHTWYARVGAYVPDDMPTSDARAILTKAINGEAEA